MADEIQVFQVTTPVGISADAPQVTALQMPPRTVKQIEVVVPNGCNGALGFAFGAAGQNIIPYNDDAWIIASGEKLEWQMDRQINSGAWQLQSWNIGKYPHTIYIRFLLDFIAVIEAAPEVTPAPLAPLTTMTPVAMLDFLSIESSDGYGV